MKSSSALHLDEPIANEAIYMNTEKLSPDQLEQFKERNSSRVEFNKGDLITPPSIFHHHGHDIKLRIGKDSGKTILEDEHKEIHIKDGKPYGVMGSF